MLCAAAMAGPQQASQTTTQELYLPTSHCASSLTEVCMCYIDRYRLADRSIQTGRQAYTD